MWVIFLPRPHHGGGRSRNNPLKCVGGLEEREGAADLGREPKNNRGKKREENREPKRSGNIKEKNGSV